MPELRIATQNKKVARIFFRGDIHTQVATLNVNMTLESETPNPPLLMSTVATNRYAFVSKEDKKVVFLKL